MLLLRLATPARPQDFLEHTLYLRKEHVRAILLRFCDPSEYRPSNARGADYQANWLSDASSNITHQRDSKSFLRARSQVQVLWDRMADLHVSEAQRHRELTLTHKP